MACYGQSGDASLNQGIGALFFHCSQTLHVISVGKITGFAAASFLCECAFGVHVDEVDTVGLVDGIYHIAAELLCSVGVHVGGTPEIVDEYVGFAGGFLCTDAVCSECSHGKADCNANLFESHHS